MDSPESERVREWSRLARHSPLAVLVDLDGTLIPLAPTPAEARPGPDVLALLGALSAAGGVSCTVVSGRPRDALGSMLGGVPGLRLVAEHGMWRRGEAGEAWMATVVVDGAALDELEGLVAPVVSGHAGALLERKSASVCVHYRLVGGSGRDAFLVGTTALLTRWLASHPDFELLDLAEAIEVRARVVTKAAAVAWTREGAADVVCVALGDDLTDEDVFAALAPGDAGIQVGAGRRRKTAARWRLPDPPAVHAFLRALLDRRGGRKVASDVWPRPIARATGPVAAAGAGGAPAMLAISNRLPHLRDPAQPAESRKRNVGGLVSALEPVLAARRGLWLGWSGKTVAHGDTSDVKIDADASPPLAWIDLPAAWEDKYYNGFCNRSLWPLFHSFPARVRFADDEWDAYMQANDAFAEAACALVDRDASIWVHDYHLLLVGAALRRRGHRGPIGLFLHIPFPSVDLFEMLPWYDTLLSALLDFDLVGFHTPGFARNFAECAARLTAATVNDETIVLGARTVRARAFPIGIMPATFQEEPDAQTAGEIAALVDALHPTRLLLGVDRLDYTKGIPERLTAFDRLLHGFPEWRGKVSLVQVSVPSREDVPEYAEQRQLIENAVGRINGEYGEAHWVPVRYLYRSYGRNHLSQLYRAAHVGYVTPLRDGMNLVAKEFVAAQDPADPGVLLLSRFAGAAVELADAVLTNPYHPDGMARDLDRALRMDATERRARHQALMVAVSRTTALSWATDFVAALEGQRP